MREEKKELILAVAEKIFARFGMKKTTMDEIARKAHVGKSTLYYYFESKEQIFAEVIQQDSRLLKRYLGRAVSAGTTPKEKLRNYVQTRMKHIHDLGIHYTTITDEYLEQYAFVEEARRDFFEFEIMSLRMILEEGTRTGIFSVGDTSVVARNLAIALKGLEYPLLILETDLDYLKETDMILDILFKGIEVR
jgi:AcrR family transcriptional regulator